MDKPRDPDNYCFVRGAKKAGGGDGWADVWKRNHFDWGKKPGITDKEILIRLLALNLQRAM